MPFTAVERDQILGYLGYPVTPGNVQRIQGACNDLTAASPEGEVRVRTFLNSLITLESELAAERKIMGGAFSQLKGEARMFVGRISLALKVEANDGVF